MNCGLLGRTLGHSYSPRIHSLLGDYAYSLFEKEPEQLEQFLLTGDFTGINVTIPYKKAVIPYLDELSPTAAKMGAVNTIVRRADGSLWGHNTDYYGFASMVHRSGLTVAGKKVLVLGSGGAAGTAVQVLQEMGANAIVISRTGENNYRNLCLHTDAAVVVNATPVGMFPHNEGCPLDISQFPKLEGVLDLIYNPARTSLLSQAEARGLVAENGLWMLVAQAKEAAECFTGKPIPETEIARIHRILSREMKNLVLIGMPGSGKTTIGQSIARQTGRTFADADEMIVSMAGKSIPRIFAEDGEAVFRDWETKALEMLGKQSGLVISTGGGCVTRQRNLSLLRQNGVIFWLQRDTAHLPTEGRPLSQTGRLEEMYQRRRPMYQAFADYPIDNNGSESETLSAIFTRLEEMP